MPLHAPTTVSPPSADPTAFASVVRRHTPLVRATAMRLLHCRADADDVVQETFLAAWTHLESIVDPEAIGAWLVTTARRRSYDRLRRGGSSAIRWVDESTPATEDHAPTGVAERSSLADAASAVLATMPAVQRRCWELRHLDELPYREVAAAIGLPVSTVRGMLVRARSTLARELAGWR